MSSKSERFEMRLHPEMISRVDDWRRKQKDLPSRAEAIRRLLDAALPGRRGARSIPVSNLNASNDV
jgi:hypothetical protein